MTYRAVGIQVEGIGALDVAGATLWAYGRSTPSAVTIEGQTCLVVNDALVSVPQMSGTELDPLSGDIRSGGLSIKLHLHDPIASAFLAQAVARRPQATLAAPLLVSELEATFTQALAPGLYHVGEEVIQVGSVISGFTYGIIRGVASTQTLEHRSGTSLYDKPSWWAGRRARLVIVDLDQNGNSLAVSVRWAGYLSKAPEAVSSTSTLALQAEDALSTIRRIEVNKAPFPYNVSAPWEAYRGTDDRHRIFGALSPSDYRPRVRKLDGWSTDGFYRAFNAGEAILITKGESTVDGLPVLDSPTPSEALVKVEGPYFEVAVWSPSYPDITPTRALSHPLHPLSIAAALLFSSSSESEDTSRYDVLDGSWGCGLGYLLDASPWDALIEATGHVQVDQLVLGYKGEPVKVWDLITKELLPAYGFALTQSPAGALIPIQIGLADIEDYSEAPQVSVLPGTWEWSSGLGGALDELRATIGALPWREGRQVTITGDGVRTQAGSRAMRSVKPTLGEISCPTIAGDVAESFASTTLLSRLLWRYDGMPSVKCRISEGDIGFYCGQWLRLQRPDGGITPLLFDRAGSRVDTWDTEPLIAQITSLRYIAGSGYYEVTGLLTNYSFGQAAKWRAPAARILSRVTTAQYLVSGTSDFDDPESDALTLSIGDEIILRNRVLRTKVSGVKVITAIAPSGINYLVTLDSDWGTVGVADDWLYIARAENYENSTIVDEYLYPYVVQTNGATITRPSSSTDPDSWS